MRKISLLFTFIIISHLALAQINSDEALAIQYFQTGEFARAADSYQKLFNKSKNIAYYDPYLTSLLRSKQYDDAEQLVRKQLKNNSQNYIFSVDLGRIFQERGMQEKAVNWYNDLIKNLPANELSIRDLATAFYRAETYDYAIKTFVAGRKLINDEDVFSFDLIGLYRYRKDKAMLIQ
ncbi:MAG: hypothetical protein WBP45_14075, partial [Daejeonella sp.]